MSEQTDMFGQRRDTLAEARAMVQRQRDDGVICPCCWQFAKIYKRKLSSGMALALLHFYRGTQEDPTAWWDLTAVLLGRKLIAANTNAALLRHWKLIEAKVGDRNDGSSRVGMHRVTPLGQAFARGEALVSRYAMLYNQELLGLTGDPISIRDALGDKFNYSELMAL